MTAMSSMTTALLSLLARVDPNVGAPAAQQGAVQRLSEPNVYDIIFPVIAFGLVIMLPVGTALWVLSRTLKNSQKEADEI
jgi:hypothetical protein